MSLLPILPGTPSFSSLGNSAGAALLGGAFGGTLDYLQGVYTIIPKGMIDTIPIQATLSERYTDRLEVTKHPVQKGAQISDHTYVLMPTITLRCGWSNAQPLPNLSSVVNNGINNYAQGNTNLLWSPSSDATPATFAGGSLSVSDYVGAIYSQLLALQQSGTMFDVVTTLRQYTSMVITDLSVLERDQTTSQALIISVTCEQLLVVDTQSAQLPPITNQANPPGTAQVQQTGAQSLGSAVSPSSTGSAPQTSW